MKQLPILGGAAALAIVLAACVMPPSMYERASYESRGDAYESGRASAPDDPRMPAHQLDRTDPMREGAETQTYENARPSRETGVVAGSPPGRVQTVEGTPRGLEAPPAGRMHIIELYQQVLDERDALSEEVDYLRGELETTRLALDGKNAANDELTSRLATLDAAHQALLADNQAIASRLVQAQIRRLEAEKMLLETRIESERAKNDTRAAATPSKGAAPATKPTTKTPSKGHGEDHE